MLAEAIAHSEDEAEEGKKKKKAKTEPPVAQGSQIEADEDNEASVNNFRICDNTKAALADRGIKSLFPIQVGTSNGVM